MTRITLHTEALPSSAGLLTRCQLVVVQGVDAGRAIEIGAQGLVVGTDPSCDLVLTDERISARHMELIEVDGRVRVRDLESRNGTLFEGSRISEASLRTAILTRFSVRVRVGLSGKGQATLSSRLLCLKKRRMISTAIWAATSPPA